LDPAIRSFQLADATALPLADGSFDANGRNGDEARSRALQEYATLNEHDRRRISVQREA
jgi:hypothetical protein